MKSLPQNAWQLNAAEDPVVFINHEHVLNNLSEIVDLVEQYAKKQHVSTLSTTQIMQFWQKISSKLKSCWTDCQQLHCY